MATRQDNMTDMTPFEFNYMAKVSFKQRKALVNHHSFLSRDSCRCSQCVNQDTMQRNFNISDLPSVKPTSVQVDTAGLRVTCKLSVPPWVLSLF